MYNPKSRIATEFIDHEEILDTLRYAKEHQNDIALVNSIIERAGDCKGLSHREAAVLLLCEDQEMIQKMFDQAAKIKQAFYGNRIVMFAPLYLSNYCVNGCVYCPYHKKIRISAVKSLHKRKSSRKLQRCRIWAINALHWKRAKIR